MKARAFTSRDNKIIYFYDQPADTILKTDLLNKKTLAGFVSKKEDYFEPVWFISYENEFRKRVSEAKAKEIAPHLFA